MKRTITELENLFMISANQAKEITKANSGINQTNIINLLLKSIKETLEYSGVATSVQHIPNSPSSKFMIKHLKSNGYKVITDDSQIHFSWAKATSGEAFNNMMAVQTYWSEKLGGYIQAAAMRGQSEVSYPEYVMKEATAIFISELLTKAGYECDIHIGSKIISISWEK